MTIINGDCREVMKGMPEKSVHTIITDPPYGLSEHKTSDVLDCLKAWVNGEVFAPKGKGFMGKSWDSWCPGPEIWKECLRVLKPGGHMLVFAGTRSMDLMCMAVRLAGFELRDSIGYLYDTGGAPLMAWCHGSGFPKGTDVGKNIDKHFGKEREVVGTNHDYLRRKPNGMKTTGATVYGYSQSQQETDAQITAPATAEAKQWDGWKTALKPAFEPIIIARRPLEGRVVDNVLKYGTGAYNIKDCLVGTSEGLVRPFVKRTDNFILGKGLGAGIQDEPAGRYPANLILDGSDNVKGCFPETGPAKRRELNGTEDKTQINAFGDYKKRTAGGVDDDGGSASRFFQQCPPDDAKRVFYCAKASKGERNAGCEGMPESRSGSLNFNIDDGAFLTGSGNKRQGKNQNTHPTCKPLKLLQYLCRLTTVKGGIILDPFVGSGSTGVAAINEGMNFIGIEIDSGYCDIANSRMGQSLSPKSA